MQIKVKRLGGFSIAFSNGRARGRLFVRGPDYSAPIRASTLQAPTCSYWEAMCEKCVEIDRAIQRFRRIDRSINGLLTVERAQEVIADLEAMKAALHTEPRQQPCFIA
jgi:hypothetical protein